MEYDYGYYDNFYSQNVSSNYSGNYGDYGPYEYYSEYSPHKYKPIADWEIPIKGPLTFIIATMTIITNILLISVFVFRSNRSPTTIILTSLAVSNSAICITQIPEAIYFNMAGNYKNPYMRYEWCVTKHVMYVIYNVFRMTSNWLTVLLGLQRLLAVCTPFYYSRICNPKSTSITVTSITVIAVLVCLYEALGKDIKELPIYTTYLKNETLPSGCTIVISQSLIDVVGDIKRSMMVYYILVGFLSRLLPIIILLITTLILVVLLHNRITSSRSSDMYQKKQLKRINKLVLTILIVFLIVEIQDGIAFLIYAYELATDQKWKIMSKKDDLLWYTISSTLSLMSYDFIFWIFFMMSTQFRRALWGMLYCRNKRLSDELQLESTTGKTNSLISNMSSSDTRITKI
ncbi:sex peptide receptor-related protein 2-like [Crassostrea virginica]